MNRFSLFVFVIVSIVGSLAEVNGASLEGGASLNGNSVEIHGVIEGPRGKYEVEENKEKGVAKFLTKLIFLPITLPIWITKWTFKLIEDIITLKLQIMVMIFHKIYEGFEVIWNLYKKILKGVLDIVAKIGIIKIELIAWMILQIENGIGYILALLTKLKVDFVNISAGITAAMLGVVGKILGVFINLSAAILLVVAKMLLKVHAVLLKLPGVMHFEAILREWGGKITSDIVLSSVFNVLRWNEKIMSITSQSKILTGAHRYMWNIFNAVIGFPWK
ncbi:unnamed protein product [Brassicogethes aeneus]|uniref:Uncharacterized protein n=1 Tax=Brassicogethes aeneus TaxID=1431903 RepID=A0A9P0B5H9_BRAAE|nr:unnamed protein product [Brassicogethes aeneus]